MSSSIDSFRNAIDRHRDAASSVVLRYLNAVQLDESPVRNPRLKDLLARASVAEGLRIVSFHEYRGVTIDILDECSLMHTGTLKSIDGCVTGASCVNDGIGRIVFESGGNTGAALAAYATRLGIESFCVVPEDNLPLLDSSVFSSPLTHLITVKDAAAPRAVVALLEETYGLTRVPKTPWRFLASEFVGCFILEQLSNGRGYDHLVQSISAAFGPIGIYRVLERFGTPLPRFIGVQQASNAAMVTAIRAGSTQIEPAKFRSTRELLSRVMYDATPQRYGTLDSLRELLGKSGGFLSTIDHAEFDALVMRGPDGIAPLRSLALSGIEITQRDGEVLEKTGLMALAGTLKQIDAGAIPRGSRVLCCLTGGTANPDGRAVPEVRIGNVSSARELFSDRWSARAGK